MLSLKISMYYLNIFSIGSQMFMNITPLYLLAKKYYLWYTKSNKYLLKKIKQYVTTKNWYIW